MACHNVERGCSGLLSSDRSQVDYKRRDKVLCWFRSMSFPTILNASCFDLGRHCNLNGIALYKLLQRPFSPDVFIFPKY